MDDPVGGARRWGAGVGHVLQGLPRMQIAGSRSRPHLYSSPDNLCNMYLCRACINGLAADAITTVDFIQCFSPWPQFKLPLCTTHTNQVKTKPCDGHEWVNPKQFGFPTANLPLPRQLLFASCTLESSKFRLFEKDDWQVSIYRWLGEEQELKSLVVS